MFIVIMHPLFFTRWPSTTYAETIGYAIHSLETMFATPFKPTSLVQLMFGKPVYKYEFKWIQIAAIALDISGHRRFKPVGIKKDEIDKRFFLRLSFANKGIDATNLCKILLHKSVKSKIPPYFKDQSVPIISYSYTIPIAAKLLTI